MGSQYICNIAHGRCCGYQFYKMKIKGWAFFANMGDLGVDYGIYIFVCTYIYIYSSIYIRGRVGVVGLLWDVTSTISSGNSILAFSNYQVEHQLT